MVSSTSRRPEIADELRETLVGIAGQLATLQAAAAEPLGHAAPGRRGRATGHRGSRGGLTGSAGEEIESIEDGVVVCDHEELVVVANRQARSMQGPVPRQPSSARPFPFSIGFRTAVGAQLSHQDHPLLSGRCTGSSCGGTSHSRRLRRQAAAPARIGSAARGRRLHRGAPRDAGRHGSVGRGRPVSPRSPCTTS